MTPTQAQIEAAIELYGKEHVDRIIRTDDGILRSYYAGVNLTEIAQFIADRLSAAAEAGEPISEADENHRMGLVSATAVDGAAWDKWYATLPSDLRRKLSLHDFKRLGDCFEAALMPTKEHIKHTPDVLEALQIVMGDGVHGQHMTWTERCNIGRAAIAKAIAAEAERPAGVASSHLGLGESDLSVRSDYPAGHSAFGASHIACYKWPKDTPEHKALRAAYIEGAADAAPTAFAKYGPTGMDAAEVGELQAAKEDAILFGTGYLKILPDGTQKRIDQRNIFLSKDEMREVLKDSKP